MQVSNTKGEISPKGLPRLCVGIHERSPKQISNTDSAQKEVEVLASERTSVSALKQRIAGKLGLKLSSLCRYLHHTIGVYDDH